MTAQLRLRSGTAELVWPPGDASGVTVLLGGDERLCRSLAGTLGTVVLNVAAGDGADAIEWVADHAGQLGAGDRLILAGATDAVLRVAQRVRAAGWPALTHLLLVRPRSSDPA